VTAIPRRRYFVRELGGRELVCPSLADLHALYTQGFFGEDDEVRAEGSERWVRAGDMPALAGARERRSDPRRMRALLLASIAAALLGGLLLARWR